MDAKIDFPKAEEEIQAYWKEIDAFHTQLKKSEGRPGTCSALRSNPPFEAEMMIYVLDGRADWGIQALTNVENRVH